MREHATSMKQMVQFIRPQGAYFYLFLMILPQYLSVKICCQYVLREYSYFMTTTYPWTPIYYFGDEGINPYCSAA